MRAKKKISQRRPRKKSNQLKQKKKKKNHKNKKRIKRSRSQLRLRRQTKQSTKQSKRLMRLKLSRRRKRGMKLKTTQKLSSQRQTIRRKFWKRSVKCRRPLAKKIRKERRSIIISIIKNRMNMNRLQRRLRIWQMSQLELLQRQQRKLKNRLSKLR